MAYRIPARRRQLDLVDDDGEPMRPDTTTDFAGALILFGVLIAFGAQAWAAFAILSGQPDTVLQEQSTSAFASMLTLGAIAVFILPGIYLLLQRLGRRK